LDGLIKDIAPSTLSTNMISKHIKLLV